MRVGAAGGAHATVSSVSFSNVSGRRVVSGSVGQDGARVGCRVGGNACWGRWRGTPTVSSVSFSADGRRVVSGSYDNTVRVWDAVSGECVLGPLEGHTEGEFGVVFC